MAVKPRRSAVVVDVGGVKVGGNHPIVVQSMTNTDTVDVPSTVNQVMALARAGSELVRVTVNTEQAAAAVHGGADYLVVGTIYDSASHPGHTGAGAGLVREAAKLGRPVIAIGGVTTERAAELRDAGAYGIATISAAWRARDPAAATLALLAPWLEAA